MAVKTQQSKSKGVAALFNAKELKKFVKAYIFFLLMLEIFIFLVCLICQLEPINIPFPWRNYFLGALLIPIAITFLLGVVATALNLFFFGEDTSSGGSLSAGNRHGNPFKQTDKFDASLNAIKQVPFLLSLALICIGVILFSQLDKLFTLLARIGEQAVPYLFLGLAVALGIATVFIFAWLILKYKLEKLKCMNDYKLKMAAQLGVYITDDNTMIDNGGRVFQISDARPAPSDKTRPEETPRIIAQKDNM